MRAVRISDLDNVAVVVAPASKGEILEGTSIKALCDIPQGHKIALKPIRKGEEVIRYGAVLGYMKEDIEAGGWINEFNLELPSSPAVADLTEGSRGRVPTDLPERKTWMGFDNGPGLPAGSRNILGIITSVQCVAGVVRNAVDKIRKEILPGFPNVDDVVAVVHPYGCGVAIKADNAEIPIRSVRNLAHHPNFGGQIMAVGLGCEKLTMDMILTPEENNPDNVIILQECRGYGDMIREICDMAVRKLEILNRRKRTELPLEKLRIGAQCGGSDAFSGISANPTIGYAFDLLAAGGATVLFSEVTEVRDGVHILAERCKDRKTVEKLKKEISWYDDYLEKSHVDRSANPSPGNKKGGLSNIVEKAMGSIAKSGHSPIADVIGPGEFPTCSGVIFAATPASDIVCGPSQLASGIVMQLFSTGRGTPYGLHEIPVFKICTQHSMKEQWPDLFDLDAGDVVTGEKTIAQMGRQLYDDILDVVSGKSTCAERYGIYNDVIVFNPAPIT
ncbi:MAG: UxaA family hydrolase [bacterium]|jgi:galactarate dehydratase|nr:UxaA family hydrolase [Spirochaetales bacterium]MDT3389024.1 UxaA family hydrolase [bacterium]